MDGHSLIEEDAPQRRRLRDLDAARGVFQDRFDLIDQASKTPLKRAAVSIIRALPPARLVAHLAMPSTWVLAIRR